MVQSALPFVFSLLTVRYIYIKYTYFYLIPPSLPVSLRSVLLLHGLVEVFTLETQFIVRAARKKVTSYIGNGLDVAAKQSQNIL